MSKIIDTHAHIGISRFTNVGINEEDILKSMSQNDVFASLVMPQPSLENIPTVHHRIFKFTQQQPNRIFGIASIDPWLDDAEYEAEAVRCLEQYRFVALKLHPLGHNISPLSANCEKIYRNALKYDVPVLVHTGYGTPFSLPSLMIGIARQYPEVIFVLSHAGFAIYTDEAIVAAKTCENIILEPSWCPTYTVQKMIHEIGLERILFGSDHLTNVPVELTKFRSIGLNDEQLETIFYHNPKRIFKLDL